MPPRRTVVRPVRDSAPAPQQSFPQPLPYPSTSQQPLYPQAAWPTVAQQNGNGTMLPGQPPTAYPNMNMGYVQPSYPHPQPQFYGYSYPQQPQPQQPYWNPYNPYPQQQANWPPPIASTSSFNPLPPAPVNAPSIPARPPPGPQQQQQFRQQEPRSQAPRQRRPYVVFTFLPDLGNSTKG